MIGRRTVLTSANASLLLACSPLKNVYADNLRDTSDLQDLINRWVVAPQNSQYFRQPGAARGSLLLAPSDSQVIRAATLLNGVPTSLSPIETARYLYQHLPAGERMAWPADHNGVAEPANPIIVAFFAATNTRPYKGDQTAWCAAFVCWTLQRAGHRHPGDAGSQSFRNWGKSTPTPSVGDLAVFQNNAHPQQGHVTYFDGWANDTKTRFWCLGGNQGNKLNRVSFGYNAGSLKLIKFITDI